MDGLNLLNGYDVWCHYDEKRDKNEVLALKQPTIVAYEESGILFDGKEFKSIGKEYLIFPNDFK